MHTIPNLALNSFADQLNVMIVGAGGGIGGAMVNALLEHPQVMQVYSCARKTIPHQSPKFSALELDLTNEASIKAAFEAVDQPLDIVVIATGLLHSNTVQPEKSLRELSPQAMIDNFTINAIGPALIAKYALPKLKKQGKTVFAALSARVGSISDNSIGGWHSYRASKAALNMYLKNIAIEGSRKLDGLVVAGLQPGTVDTGLSKPFQGHVKQDKLFSPEFSAISLLNVLNRLDTSQSGRFFDWSGAEFAP